MFLSLVNLLAHIFRENIEIIVWRFKKVDLDDSVFPIFSDEMIPNVDVTGSHPGFGVLRHKHHTNIISFHNSPAISLAL
jgi:hypothetical protein